MGCGVDGTGVEGRGRAPFDLGDGFAVDPRVVQHAHPPVRGSGFQVYMGTSLIRNRRRPKPYSTTMPRALEGSSGGGRFLMSEVLL